MRTSRAFLFVSATLLLLALPRPRPAAAIWPADPSVNVPLCTATGNQIYPAITSDGVGGAIVTWADGRSGNLDIYVQRISANGTVQWMADGVALCTAADRQDGPAIASDGAGGAIVVWNDPRSGGINWDVYAQRISASGVVQWTADGVALCTATNGQYNPAIASDGAGGAIVTWQDDHGDLSAQRISADGTIQWTADGVALCIADNGQYWPRIIADGAGGAIIVWEDERNSEYGDLDLYAQRISADGTIQWITDGVALCTATYRQDSPAIASDGAGGAIVTWSDYRGGNSYADIYAQRILASGTVQWAADGVALSAAADRQWHPAISADGAGGAIVTWGDGRSGNNEDIYAQRISANGAVEWMADGVALCTATGSQIAPAIISDGAGGAVVTWQDDRHNNYYEDICAQRISAGGAVQWTVDGVALCTATNYQYAPKIVSDGAEGAIVTWWDNRNGNPDIYAQRVDASGQLGTDPVAVYLTQFQAERHGQRAMVQWTTSRPRDHAGFHVWRQEPGHDRVCLSPSLLSGQTAYDFTDVAPPVGAADYWLQEIAPDGPENWYGPAHLDAATVPTALRLYQAAPNPFNPRTTIRFEIPVGGRVRLAVYDVAGRLVKVLVEGEILAGSHEAVWDGRNSAGQAVASGSYFARLVAGGKVEVVRMGLIR